MKNAFVPFLVIFILFIFGCKKEVARIPVLSTVEISNVTADTAISGGSITDDGGSVVTARGVCWSSNTNPTVDDDKTSDGSGAGTFSSIITGFDPDISYNVRAYAINNAGTGYGNQVNFIYESPTGTFHDIRDNNEYNWLRIGNQVWMTENLAYLPSVSPPSLNSQTIAYYYVYDYTGTSVSEAKATSNYATYGVLYNYVAALESCPSGWHLPSDTEWTELEVYLQNNGYIYSGYFDTDNERETYNAIAKSLATDTGWTSSIMSGSIGNTDFPDYRNKSGFSALPGGYLNNDGTFKEIFNVCSLKSSTESSSSLVWGRMLLYYYQAVTRTNSSKSIGNSVRCLKD
jgi:uncharacterized protein (TIGR02145 family)